VGIAGAALFVVSLAIQPAWSAEPPRKPKVVYEIHERQVVSDAFARALLAKLAEQKGNVIVSPTSIETCVLLALAGARGETAQQIQTALQLAGDQPIDIGKLLDRFQSDLEPAEKPRQGKDTKPQEQSLVIANSVWVQNDFPIQASYRKLLETNGRATFELVDFANQLEAARKAINTWVDETTKHKIPELLGPTALERTARLVLCNAIYFRGQWASPFETELTRDQPFRRPGQPDIQVPLMHQQDYFGYLETEKYQAIELPYLGREESMIVWLPKRPEGLADLEKSLTADSLAPTLNGMRRKEVKLFLPRFKIGATLALADTLASLGMKQAFTPAADFKGISDESLFLSAVIHQALVEVDEVGTEAAAATAIVAVTAAAPQADPPQPVVFRADHPFVFAIRNMATGEVLFLGRVDDPKP
jgi:serpin B